MFVQERFLRECLGRNLSLEEIGRRADRHPSTVSYWLKKHGLEATNRDKHRTRGGLEKDELEELVARGRSVRAIAEQLGVSYSTVRHWLNRYGLETTASRRRRSTNVGSDGRIERECRRHGRTVFVQTGRQGTHLRCAICRAEREVARRRRIKQILVAEAGGCCRLCGYDRSVVALQFHHVDRGQKEFGLALRGVARSLDRARAEARKCVLLCANCHAEVEWGDRHLALECQPSPGLFPG